MTHLGTLELWKMRDGRVYGRQPSRVNGVPPTWYAVKEGAGNGGRPTFFVTPIGFDSSDQLEIDFQEEKRKAEQGSLFGSAPARLE